MVFGICVFLGLQLADRHGKSVPDSVLGRKCLYTGETAEKALPVQRGSTLFQLAAEKPRLSEHGGFRNGLHTLLYDELDQLLALDFSSADGRSHTERLRHETQVPAEVQEGHLSNAQPAGCFSSAFVLDAEGSLRLPMAAAVGSSLEAQGGYQ